MEFSVKKSALLGELSRAEGVVERKTTIRRQLNYVGFLLRLTTLLLPFLAFAVAGYVSFSSHLVPKRAAEVIPRPYFELLLMMGIVWALATGHFGLDRVENLFAAKGKARRLLAACIFSYTPVMAVALFDRGAHYSRLFLALSAVTLFVMANATRVAFLVALDSRRRNRQGGVRILIVGTDEYARKSVCSLLQGQVMPCRIVGYVRLPGQEVVVEDGPVFEMEHIGALTNGNGADDVVIALPVSRLGEIQKIMPTLEALCVPTRVILDFGVGVSIRDRLFDFGGVQMLDLGATPAETASYIVLKRIFDVIFSALVLLAGAPLMLLIALAIRLGSSGPVLFAQDRVGLNGKTFRMFKFRTMKVSDSQESDTRWTGRDDTRRTWPGALLRRANLDELPQFFNVLKGDMSIVGPRPERPYFVEKFLHEIDKYNSRHVFKVGITGWAQVNGWRGDTSIAKRIEYDRFYLRNWSMTFDFQIIFLTMLRMFASKNAY
jgi:Undecaprenyl-phosphate glucose phosphotransferase